MSEELCILIVDDEPLNLDLLQQELEPLGYETASASEIFAGAMRDYRRGEVIGQRTYGKGSVQGIFPLQVVRAGVRLTTARFYSPSGQPISERGVLPNVIVRQAAKPGDGSEHALRKLDSDPVLVAAQEAARRQVVAQR